MNKFKATFALIAIVVILAAPAYASESSSAGQKPTSIEVAGSVFQDIFRETLYGERLS